MNELDYIERGDVDPHFCAKCGATGCVSEVRAEVERLREGQGWRPYYERTAEQRDRYREALEYLRGFHVQGDDEAGCRSCNRLWPCATIRIVRAALDGNDDE